MHNQKSLYKEKLPRCEHLNNRAQDVQKEILSKEMSQESCHSEEPWQRWLRVEEALHESCVCKAERDHIERCQKIAAIEKRHQNGADTQQRCRQRERRLCGARWQWEEMPRERWHWEGMAQEKWHLKEMPERATQKRWRDIDDTQQMDLLFLKYSHQPTLETLATAAWCERTISQRTPRCSFTINPYHLELSIIDPTTCAFTWLDNHQLIGR